MKIFGWMHRKFLGNEPFKDSFLGNPCTCLSREPSLDDLQYYSHSNYAAKTLDKPLGELRSSNSYAGLDSKYNTIEKDGFDHDSLAANSELFHGFLTIGTFGSDPLVDDPKTPTFSFSVENIAEKEEEVTEDDLKRINDELDKVLGNEEDGSVGRKSEVSAGGESPCTAITLSGKTLEGTDSANTICPLQGYLFGSKIDLAETTVVRKEQRTSLRDLFQMTKMEEEDYDDKNDKKKKKKGNGKSAILMMKNVIKKAKGHSPGVNEKKVDSGSSNKKLHKILRVFHRKVYPEGEVASRKHDKPYKNEKKNNPLEENTMIYPRKIRLSKDGEGCFKSHCNLSETTVGERDYNGNREFWIKTDSDYLVLEL